VAEVINSPTEKKVRNGEVIKLNMTQKGFLQFKKADFFHVGVHLSIKWE
jgi:hypothetical protein